MSHITFDFQCPDCGHRETRLVRRSEMDQQVCPVTNEGIPLPPCAATMVRLPAGTRTNFRFADRRLKR